MIWQDVVLMIGGFVFSIALIPSIRGKQKPAKSSCLLTGSALTVYSIVYFTLGLWLACVSGVLTALAWWILLFQRREK